MFNLRSAGSTLPAVYARGRSGSVDEVEVLGRALGMRGRHGKFMDYDGGRYGMAILSRVPIVSWQNIALPPGAEPRSALAARGAGGQAHAPTSITNPSRQDSCRLH